MQSDYVPHHAGYVRVPPEVGYHRHRSPSSRRNPMVNGLPYIPIKRLFQAVKFSIAMQRNDVHPDVADAEAAGNYGCNRELVENYTARALP
jgi:hypothetical protein